MEYHYPKFTPEMKKTHTILIPNSVTLCRYDKSTLCGCTVKTATGTEHNEL